MIKHRLFFVLALLGFCLTAPAEDSQLSLEEKAGQVNKELIYLKQQLKEKYARASFLYQKQADEKAFLDLIAEIRRIKEKKADVENYFHRFLIEKNRQEEAYAFWDQGDTTLGQLIMEYGSSDYLYVMPPEIANIKLNMSSALAIAHENFEEIIDMILEQSGIGVKKLNSYLRQLFVLKQEPGFIEYVASNAEKLAVVPEDALVFYLLSPPPDEVRSVFAFLEKFSSPKAVTLQTAGSNIAISARKKNLEKLLLIYEAAYGESRGKNYRVYNLAKLKVEEAEKIIRALFTDNTANRSRPPFLAMRQEEIGVVPLKDKSALVFLGDDAKIEKAFELLSRLEEQLQQGEENTFFWYTCQHSDPQEIADLLGKLFARKTEPGKNAVQQQPDFPHMPADFSSDRQSQLPKEAVQSIVVDPKTSSVLMIVKKDEVKTLKEILRKIDIPKRMVQIDVLLVERTLRDRKQTGVNILKIGSAAGEPPTSLQFNASEQTAKRGILDFIYSHSKGCLPSFDLALSFLLAQEDVKINANPSILAVNQTPAKISLVEESSINTGAIKIEGSKNIEQSYSRMSYGTTIVITPTVHLSDDEKEKGYITMQTNINFESLKQNVSSDRPPVTRRHIENEVCVADGETVVLGGLRRKAEEDNREKLPFLGDLPGFGKLFGSTRQLDDSTETFIFITPRIIKDPREAARQKREEMLKKRPGDIPEFLAKLEEAKKKEKKKLFEDSLKVFFENF